MNLGKTAKAFTVFETAIGACSIVWNARGVVGVQLPEASGDKTRARTLKRYPNAEEAAPPASVRDAMGKIVRLLSGEPVDLSTIALDMNDVPAFNRRVYEIARTVQPGNTISYGEITARMKEPREVARDVGQALGQNPFPIIVPCHRVLAANGKPGGFSAPGGVATKLRLLSIEGAKTGDAPTLFEDLPLSARPAKRS